jgi:hypothetical protein
VQCAQFIAISADEVTACDNSSWISIHAYLVENWERVPLLLKVQKLVAGTKANDIVAVLVAVLEERGGLKNVDIQKRLVSVGADGDSVF